MKELKNKALYLSILGIIEPIILLLPVLFKINYNFSKEDILIYFGLKYIFTIFLIYPYNKIPSNYLIYLGYITLAEIILLPLSVILFGSITFNQNQILIYFLIKFILIVFTNFYFIKHNSNGV